MSSVARNKKSGSRRIQFLDNGKRYSVPLGKCTQKQANHFQVMFDSLLASRFSVMDDQTAQWVAGLPDDMHGKLVGLGIVKPREATRTALLGETIDWYITTHKVAVKPSSVPVWNQTRQRLIDYFGADKHLSDITEGDAKLWRLDMAKKGYAEATIRKRCQNAKMFARFAKEHKLITENPFRKLKSSSVANESRMHIVSPEDIQKVIDACPDHEWRLIFALCRFGGLRCPSEVLSLRWQSINWEKGRMTIASPKTERHEGGESRIVPIFGELLPYLQETFDQADDGAVNCITRYRLGQTNLRTQAHRIIKRAGLKPWPRTFQNLRASRETELTETYPLKTVTQWLGNSQLVAAKHYLSVPDEHFERAAAKRCAPGVQQPSARGENGGKTKDVKTQETLKMQIPASSLHHLQESLLVPPGSKQRSEGFYT